MRDQFTDERNNLVLENKGLVYHIVNNLGVSSDVYDDIVSIGAIGLIKAASSFDSSKGFKFATYATRCITNEIFMYYRKENSYVHNVISLDTVILQDSNGNNITIGDTISSDVHIRLVEDLELSELFVKCINIILNAFNPKERLIMLYMISGKKQRDICKVLNLSQSYISRLERRLIEKLKLYLSNTVQFKEVFKLTIENDLYILTLSFDDVITTSNLLTLLQNLPVHTDLPNLNLKRNNNRIIIRFPAILSSFYSIAQIIGALDGFNMMCDKSKMNIESTSSAAGLVSSDFICEIKPDSPSELIEETVNLSTNSSSAKRKYSRKKNSKQDDLRNYILARDYFTSMELTQHFTNMSKNTISIVLRDMKNEGLIKSISKGNYSVINKT